MIEMYFDYLLSLIGIVLFAGGIFFGVITPIAVIFAEQEDVQWGWFFFWVLISYLVFIPIGMFIMCKALVG